MSCWFVLFVCLGVGVEGEGNESLSLPSGERDGGGSGECSSLRCSLYLCLPHLQVDELAALAVLGLHLDDAVGCDGGGVEWGRGWMGRRGDDVRSRAMGGSVDRERRSCCSSRPPLSPDLALSLSLDPSSETRSGADGSDVEPGSMAGSRSGFGRRGAGGARREGDGGRETRRGRRNVPRARGAGRGARGGDVLLGEHHGDCREGA